MKKYLPAYLLIITSILNAFNILNAQNITVLPNPTPQPGIFAWNGSGAYSGYLGLPIIYNNTLVAEHNAPGNSSPSFPLIQNLVVYNDSSMQVVANPVAGKGVLLQSGKIIFDNKLFLCTWMPLVCKSWLHLMAVPLSFIPIQMHPLRALSVPLDFE